MAEAFNISGESSDITAGPAPQLQGLFIPGIDNSQFVDGFGIVTPWGGGGTARKYSDYGISPEISRQSTQLNDLASSLIPAEGGGLGYGIQGDRGPQGLRGLRGLPGIITVMGLNLPQNSNFLAALPHNLDLINGLGTAVDKLIYTNAYTTVGGPTGDDLVSGTTDGDTLSEYGDWTEREISFDVAGALHLSYDTTDSTKQGGQSTLRSWYQSFIPTSTFTIEGLEINIDSIPSGTALASIYFYNADADGKPTGAALGSGSLGLLDTEDTGWQGDLTLSGAVTLTSGSRYCFQLKGFGSSGEYHFDFDSADGYANGTCWYWNGSSYVAQNGDISFKLYGTGAGTELTSGVKYSLIVKAPDVVGAAELYWSTRIDNPYESGSRFGSSDSGSTWAVQEDKDVWFKTKAGEVIKENGSFSQDAFNRAASANGVDWLSQTFTAASTYTITSVLLKLAKYTAFGGTVETVTASIRAADPTAYSEATWAESALTSAGRALLDDADAATQATTLGLGIGDAVTHDTLTLSSIAAEATDVDKFLVDSTGVVKYRTGVQVLSDIGASASAHLHDTKTLQHDAVNSDGGAFSFTTTGTVTFNQSIAAANYIATSNNTLIGEEAGNSLTGIENTFVGYQAGYSATDINKIVLIGHQAGYSYLSSITEDDIRSVLIGYQTGYNLTTGEKNTAVGNRAILSEVTGTDITAIGHLAGHSGVGASHCVLVGSATGYFNIDGTANTYIGYQTGRGIETKSSTGNVGIGYRALYNIGDDNGGAQYNVAIGYEAGLSLTTGIGNVFLGMRAGKENIDGDYNFALGTEALFYNESGVGNVCIGYEAGEGSDGNSITANIVIGYRSGRLLRADNNVFIGTQTGYDATTLHDSVLVGYRAGYNLTTLDDNVMVGKDAGYLGTTADACTYLGYQTGYTATTAARRICIGHSAGFYDTNSDRFILDNQKRTNAAEEITNALMYGVMAAAPASQTLRINAALTVSGTVGCGIITQSGATLAATYQPLDTGLSNLAALGYVSDSMIKITAEDTYEIRTMAEVKTDLSLNNVENTVHSTDAHTMTIDGRDVSVDGTKLDGIEALADVTATAETSHATVVVDGDFGSAGLMNTDGAGGYSIKAIGTDVQAYHANLAAIAGGTWTGAASITTLGTIATVGNITIANGGTIGQAAGPLLTFDDTNNTFLIMGTTKIGYGNATPAATLDFGTNSTGGTPFWLFYNNNTGINMGIWRDTPGANIASIVLNSAGSLAFGKSTAAAIPTFGTEWARFDNAGNFGLNTTTPDAQFEISRDSNHPSLMLSCYHDSETTRPIITMRKAEGSEASHATPIDDNAVLGVIEFQGYDGSGFHAGARIEARIDGTPSDGTDMPTELTFWTTPEASATPVQRVAIKPDGAINISNYLKLLELAADPAEPGEGESILWLSDGTGYGDDGDVCIASKAAGATKKAILFDHSAGDVW